MSSSHFKALLKKNLLILKRTYILSLIEILSPIIIMILFWRLNLLFEIEDLLPKDNEEYIDKNSYYIDTLRLTYSQDDVSGFLGFIFLCGANPIIALIGNISEELKEELKTSKYLIYFDIQIKIFDSLESLNDYVRSDKYDTDDENEGICFGITYNKNNNKYRFKMHFFTTNVFGPSIPTTNIDSLDPFRTQPDFESYYKYTGGKYLVIQKIIYDIILRIETGNPNAEINLEIIPQKYDKYLENAFNNYLSMLLGFFVLIAYALPLSINIYRLVKEKETKAKEGMKIMGLNEINYFFSYFLIFFIVNIIYSICITFIIGQVMNYIEKIYLFLFFFLYGLVIYSLVYFFQSFLEKSRIAVIFGLLIYFLMFILALPIYSNAVSRVIKIIFCILFPPITMQLGVNTISNFQINFNIFNGRVFMRYNNFSFFDMYILLICDCCLYMFLGFYLQNIIPHEYGIKRPWYFLFTKSYWGYESNDKKININNNNNCLSNFDRNNIQNKENRNNILNKKVNNDIKIDYFNIINDEKQNISSKRKIMVIHNEKNMNNSIDNEYFENEKIYTDYNKEYDVLQINNIHKEFEDGKIALNDVSFNIYRNEIFALLGHNGAGKTTLINILTGLYPSTFGSAIYNSYNILSSEGIEKFRKVLGICPQHDVLFNDLTVEEHLEMFCVFKSVEKSKIQNEISKVIHDFGLEEKRNTKVENLSGGQKRKLSIAIAIVGGSSVIFLDEPTSGMDITSRRNLWNILKRSLNGKIIILTTHYMEEASVLGNRIGILSEGKMKCIGSPLFLIEKLGKNINLNITKRKEADNDKIIEFINENFGKGINIENEIFDEEILFKIPKKNKKLNKYNWRNFFKKLDEQYEILNIKNYSISMPTLEDVFINLSKIIKQKNEIEENEYIQRRDNNNKILYDENNYHAQYNKCEKILRDLKISFKKRIIQIYRDKKTFILEILCPIILALIGCLVSSLSFLEKNRIVPVHLNQITNDSQIIFYSYENENLENTFEDLFQKYPSENISNIIYKKIGIPSGNFDDNSITIMNKLYEAQKQIKEKNFAYYIISKIDKNNHYYKFNCFIDIISRQSAPIYSNFLLNNFLRFATENKDLEVEILIEPLAYTKKDLEEKKKTNNVMVLFFISLSFTLIPSNFIAIIIKERENNSKHLQIISGISLFSYWFNNYLFELVKYYIIGGINIFLIYIFDFYQDYLYILYFEYGPAMVSFTYLFSFIFKSEDKGQTVVLLINLVIGALGGSAVIIMRLKEDLIKYAEPIIYIFRIIPSFCFCYGFNQLIQRNELFKVDSIKEGIIATRFSIFDPKDILKLKYMGYDCIYLAVESIVYLLILVFLENLLLINRYCFNKNNKKYYLNNNNNIDSENNANEINNISFPSNVNDTEVKNEIIKVKNQTDSKNYAIKVKSLVKTYYGGLFNSKIFGCCCKSTQAVRDISFCLDYGEIFGFLGVNGAGKTTTFKCLSNEIIPTSGTIYIDNNEITSNFNKIRSLMGYCPQFDAIFEYLTVYENLEFYGLIKGAKKDKIKNIIEALIEEMNLSKFKNKVSGTLSGGNKRKLSVAIALICNPPIILLDEPSTGMDPEARRYMWGVIHRVSLNQKKSTIIMTTHSMEEAETLCKRIGILVNGQFKCLSTSDEIKEKYGYGYDINLQINIPNIDEIYNIYNIKYDDKKQNINKNNLEQLLKTYGLEKYYGQIQKELLGGKIFEELEFKGHISFDKILLWIYYLKNALGMIKVIMNYFNEIYCVEHGENKFIFKIKRNKIKGEKSIGFLFGLIEENKEKYNIEQYYLQLSSLEQIFNKFAKDNNNNVNIDNSNIYISKELINYLE